MGRFVAGVICALMLTGAGLFWWQGQASREMEPLRAQPAPPAATPDSLPEGDDNAMGGPLPPEATQRTREQRRFDRYDRDRDNIITRGEMLASRVKDFRQLDKDGNNLLSFEEWAVHTTDRFDAADANKDGRVTRDEFAATAPKPAPRAKCKC